MMMMVIRETVSVKIYKNLLCVCVEAVDEPQEEILAVAIVGDDYDAEEERELTIHLGDTL